jgi:error-prone DNA polymerase
VEGKLQKEGEVIHVVVKRCFNLSGLLRGLTLVQNEEPPVLTLSRADERSEPYVSDSKRAEPNEQKEVFYGGRNFR